MPELRALVLNLLFAGHDTTKSLLANGPWTLASHPAELARLRRDPDLFPTAVEEIARYETPIPSIPRIATVDLEPLLDRPEWTAYVSTRRVAALPARVRVARRAG
jgi:cytochrome P450